MMMEGIERQGIEDRGWGIEREQRRQRVRRFRRGSAVGE
jgi:hypothetical protein